ncbi:MAG: Hpt domain-containing protein [Planctomycetaceae bacterium]|nr:Hpt domain-containing protein [Planctomycetaceae bacterium]
MSLRVDSAALHRLFLAGGLDLVEKMVDLFLKNTPDRLLQLRRGTEGRDWAVVERIAHSMKSSAAYLGLEDLRSAAALAEELARQGRGEEVRPLLASLERTFREGRGELTGIVQSLFAL